MADPPPLERPDLYVVARFLDRLCEPDAEYTRSQLQMAVRLNYDLFRKYLRLLEDRGFLSVEDGPKGLVRATSAGREARQALFDWIDRLVGRSRL